MPLAYPVNIDSGSLRAEVSRIYANVAAEPAGVFHFHRGPAYAAEFLGYDPAKLAALPSDATASFAGVGNPHATAPIRAGEAILDVGCGAGMDLLFAAHETGPAGRAIGVDMTAAMLECASRAAESAGLRNVELRQGDATSLPVDDGSVDVIISNGVLNLVPEKDRAFAELWRVLRPGGRLQVADIAVDNELGEEVRSDIDLWAG
jgi:arsenite methyltransferase